jgi:phosphate transport system substrate-binding protein
MTTKEATIANKTDVMLSTVANNPYAVGYVSIGSLSSSVKAVPIEGVIPTSANVKNGSYIISRPFNIAVGGAASDLAADFISFIMSAEGQSVVSGGYVAIDESAAAYSGSKPSGKLVVAGSSSVSPVMEQLIEAYNAINASATIELQTSDSTAGMTAAIEGNCDIGMASRALTDAELETLTATEIAIDGIALIVNNENTISDISKEQVKSIFTGETTEWSAVIN